MSFGDDAKKIAATLIGLAIAGLSGFFLWRVMQPTVPPTTPDRHLVYLFAGGIAFGMAFFLPSVFFDTASRFIGLVRQAKSASNGTPAP